MSQTHVTHSKTYKVCQSHTGGGGGGGGGGVAKVTKPSFSNSATPGAKRYYYHLADSVLEPSLIKSALVYQCLYV